MTNETKTLNFSEVLYRLKNGEKAKRSRWKMGQYVEYVPTKKINEQCTIAPYLRLVQVENYNRPYLPLMSDILADDWQIVEMEII